MARTKKAPALTSVSTSEAREKLREAGVEVGQRGRFSAAQLEELTRLGFEIERAPVAE